MSIFWTDDLHISAPHVLHLFIRSVSKVATNEKEELPLSTMSETSNYTGGSEYATNPGSPAARVSDTHEGLSFMSVKLGKYCNS